MTKHPVRTLFGLLALYSGLILGILMLQFHDNSTITHTIGSFRFIITGQKSAAGESAGDKSLHLAYRGITISASPAAPAVLYFPGGSAVPLEFDTWQQFSENSVEFIFSHGVTLRVVIDDSEQSLFFIASFPDSAESVSFEYKPSEDFAISEQTPARTILGSKTEVFVLSTLAEDAEEAGILSSQLVFGAGNPTGFYRPVNPENTLSFESLSALDLASGQAYTTMANTLTDQLIAAYEAAPQAAGEQAAAAYLAAMSARGRLAQARARIPAAFSGSSGRTYLSAPYFGSLAQMNQGLEAETAALASALDLAAGTRGLDFFKTRGLGDYIIRSRPRPQISALLRIPAGAADFAPTPSQAAGIISLYSTLLPVRREYADMLEPALAQCLQTIADALALDSGRITVNEHGAPLPLLPSADAGAALIRYGEATATEIYIQAGQLIINSLCAGLESGFDLRVLGELYPRIYWNNSYYPHFVWVADLSGAPVWAWTIAGSISYQTDQIQNITLTIDFPLGETQYLIIGGVPAFRSIEIYNTPYRTDPRFEAYNSSGYVYAAVGQTLLLKSQHRSRPEVIRLLY